MVLSPCIVVPIFL